MKLEELLPLLKPYTSVLVSGPQRSGTTIAAQILSVELDYKYVDEDEFGLHFPFRVYPFLKEGKVVIQAPALCHVAEDIGNYVKKCAVVMMRRPIADILASEARIDWRGAYGGLNLKTEQRKYEGQFGIYGANIALIKYYCWDMLQKQNCTSFDLDYDSLKTHPLWTSERESFAPRQWAKETA